MVARGNFMVARGSLNFVAQNNPVMPSGYRVTFRGCEVVAREYLFQITNDMVRPENFVAGANVFGAVVGVWRVRAFTADPRRARSVAPYHKG
jgi:hypothetical protein